MFMEICPEKSDSNPNVFNQQKICNILSGVK